MEAERIDNDTNEKELKDHTASNEDLVSKMRSLIRLTSKKVIILYFLIVNSPKYHYFILDDIIEFLKLLGLKHHKNNLLHLLKKMEKKGYIKSYRCTDCEEKHCKECPYEAYKDEVNVSKKTNYAKFVITLQNEGKLYFNKFRKDIKNINSLLNQNL